MQGYRVLYRITEDFPGLQRALQGNRGLFRVTEGFTELLRTLQGYRGLYRVTEAFTYGVMEGLADFFRGEYRWSGCHRVGVTEWVS